MLCHVMETNEIVMTIIVVYLCCECKLEGGLGYRLAVFRWLILAVKMTYALHLAEYIPSDLDDALGLQP